MSRSKYSAAVLEHYARYIPILSDPRVEWMDVRHKVSGPVARYGAILDAINRLAPRDKPALDVGVGTGLPLLLYAKTFPEVAWHGLDVPWASFEHPELAPFRDRILKCDLEKDALPSEPNRFGCVILSEVAEHIPPPAFTHALEEIHRVLAPRGVLIATSPNLVSLMNRLIFLAGRSPFHLAIRDAKYGGGYPHIHLYSAREVRQLGERLGFQTACVRHLTYFSYALVGKNRIRNAAIRTYLLAERLCGSLLPDLRDGWLVALRKPAEH